MTPQAVAQRRCTALGSALVAAGSARLMAKRRSFTRPAPATGVFGRVDTSRDPRTSFTDWAAHLIRPPDGVGRPVHAPAVAVPQPAMWVGVGAVGG